ncbi:PIG-L family deacetylase [Planktomarina temperata]|nr:PIG-L family deacetylase [Planktomarina temperata]
MQKKILVVAPHADDEVIGCGGTLLKEIERGAKVGWLIMTKVSLETGYTADFVAHREHQIAEVKKFFNIDYFRNLNFGPSSLDFVARSDIISNISKVFREFQPTDIFMPYPGDAHSDHNIVFECLRPFLKAFRYPSLKRAYCYETISETDQNFTTGITAFKPNSFVNITEFMELKLKAANIYDTEFSNHPFPRSLANLQAIALHRGGSSNYTYAEAFMCILSRED